MLKKPPIELFLIFIFSCSIFGCGVSDPDRDIIEPGERDYYWNQIILNQNTINLYYKLAGTADKIWIMAQPGDHSDHILFYQNKKINKYGYLDCTATAIFFSPSNDLWLMGNNFDIWKLQSGRFIKQFDLSFGQNNEWLIGQIWGRSNSNIYAVGSYTDSFNIKSLILKYDSQSWSKLSSEIDNLHFLRFAQGWNNTGILLGAEIEDQNHYLNFYDLNLKVFRPDIFPRTTNKTLAVLNDEVFLVEGHSIYKIHGAEPKIFLNLNNEIINGVWGRNEKDIFIKTSKGIIHYNGENLEVLLSLDPEFLISDGLIFEKDVFFIGFNKNTLKSVLIHGENREP